MPSHAGDRGPVSVIYDVVKSCLLYTRDAGNHCCWAAFLNLGCLVVGCRFALGGRGGQRELSLDIARVGEAAAGVSAWSGSLLFPGVMEVLPTRGADPSSAIPWPVETLRWACFWHALVRYAWDALTCQGGSWSLLPIDAAEPGALFAIVPLTQAVYSQRDA